MVSNYMHLSMRLKYQLKIGNELGIHSHNGRDFINVCLSMLHIKRIESRRNQIILVVLVFEYKCSSKRASERAGKKIARARQMRNQ